jgi:hypothetical protein
MVPMRGYAWPGCAGATPADERIGAKLGMYSIAALVQPVY